MIPVSEPMSKHCDLTSISVLIYEFDALIVHHRNVNQIPVLCCWEKMMNSLFVYSCNRQLKVG